MENVISVTMATVAGTFIITAVDCIDKTLFLLTLTPDCFANL